MPLSEEWEDGRLGRAEARRILRAAEEELDRLCEGGLPSRQEDGAQTFGECDVMNVGLARGNGRSIPELARGRTLRFAGAGPADWLAEKAWSVVATAECSCGAAEGDWRLAAPRPELYGGRVESVETSRAPGRLETRMAVRTNGWSGGHPDPAIAAAMEDVLAEFGSGRLRFHYLPVTLRTDPRAAVSAGVVDCVALTLHFAERLEASGIPTVTRRGHLLSAIGVEHAWLEVGDGSDRAAVDPMLVVLCDSVPGVDPAFAEFCLGSISNRVLPWDRDAEEAVCDHACGQGTTRLAVSGRAA